MDLSLDWRHVCFPLPFFQSHTHTHTHLYRIEKELIFVNFCLSVNMGASMCRSSHGNVAYEFVLSPLAVSNKFFLDGLWDRSQVAVLWGTASKRCSKLRLAFLYSFHLVFSPNSLSESLRWSHSAVLTWLLLGRILRLFFFYQRDQISNWSIIKKKGLQRMINCFYMFVHSEIYRKLKRPTLSYTFFSIGGFSKFRICSYSLKWTYVHFIYLYKWTCIYSFFGYMCYSAKTNLFP